MVIKSLELINFRNYDRLNIDFGPITVFWGPNGVGKTNIIEALGVLAYTKSFRARDERNLILTGQKYAQIKASVANDTNINFVLSLDGKNLKKEVKINGIKKNLTDLVGKLKAVLFSPESLKIITGPPSERRKFIDIIASQTDAKYLNHLIKLRHILKQRNKLLRIIANSQSTPDGLNFWDNEFINCSYYIVKERQKISKVFENNIQKTYSQFAPKNSDRIRLLYEPNIFDCDKFEELIISARQREIEAQRTLYGPHLDDLKFFINGKTFSEVGSRGEIRSLVFCLKLAEIKYLESITKKSQKVLLFLDDIFSELDWLRRKKILELINGRQTIITTTEKKFIDLEHNNINFIKLNNPMG